MSSFCDRTGCPILPVPSLGIDMQLLPVTKVQFEMFMADRNEFNDSWYEQVLAINPRASHWGATNENREQLFLTGILPAEADAFAKWLGQGWRLPTMDLWRQIRASLDGTTCLPYIDQLNTATLNPAAVEVLNCLISLVSPHDLAELSMITGGVLEWVRNGESYGGLGSPRLNFARRFCDPLHGDPVCPLRPGMRLPWFGFRLVRTRMPSGEGVESEGASPRDRRNQGGEAI